VAAPTSGSPTQLIPQSPIANILRDRRDGLAAPAGRRRAAAKLPGRPAAATAWRCGPCRRSRRSRPGRRWCGAGRRRAGAVGPAARAPTSAHSSSGTRSSMRVVMVPGPCQPHPKGTKGRIIEFTDEGDTGSRLLPATLPPGSVTSTLKLNKVWEEISVDPGSPGPDSARLPSAHALPTQRAGPPREAAPAGE
jgi:hypothetical protein